MFTTGESRESTEINAATVARQPGDPFSLTISEQITRDANIYRLPDDLDITAIVAGADLNRDDL
ncbi:MAG TPA: hypothetical protein VFS52_19005 [Steroidobacteraceae bacterium]|nr:hypothetical protein [Steroidobacteraceae bacterium]